MQSRYSRRVRLLGVLPASLLSSSLIAAAVASSLSGCTYPQIDVASAEQPRGLSVTGTGRISAEPDLASVRIGVETRHPDAKAAVEENNRRMRLVVANMKSLGLPEADLQSANFSIHFQVDRREPPALSPRKEAVEDVEEVAEGRPKRLSPSTPAPRRGEFVVNNTLVVLVRDVSKLSEVLGTATFSSSSSSSTARNSVHANSCSQLHLHRVNDTFDHLQALNQGPGGLILQCSLDYPPPQCIRTLRRMYEEEARYGLGRGGSDY